MFDKSHILKWSLGISIVLFVLMEVFARLAWKGAAAYAAIALLVFLVPTLILNFYLTWRDMPADTTAQIAAKYTTLLVSLVAAGTVLYALYLYASLIAL